MIYFFPLKFNLIRLENEKWHEECKKKKKKKDCAGLHTREKKRKRMKYDRERRKEEGNRIEWEKQVEYKNGTMLWSAKGKTMVINFIDWN